MEESDNNSRVAGLLAYHLVNLVLQEGCMIANAALESGRPREYLSSRVNAVRSDLTFIIRAGEDATYVDTAVDNFIEGADNAKIESEPNVLVTSTPQKVADDKTKKENGQGDDLTEEQQHELNNSTSLFINHLFDISDVELGLSDHTNHAQNAEYNVLSPFCINNVMDFYMNAALDAFRITEEKERESVDKRVRISGNSSFSYIEEALEDYDKDVVFYVHQDDSPCTENVYEIPQDPMTSQMALQDHSKPREGLAATSGVSAGSRKSRLVHRWRLQGARFLACIRGWWRRKATGKRKAAESASQRPLSPGVRRRAASLLDHRVSSTVLTCHAKCNTINEALLNSHHWMDYTFETKPNECGDV
ncbi:uncharacterized protein LOC133525922 isoform X2 [Cydia pomonella]|uniref:uncharacterized protein LOC133516034 isoform X2 n=1 Tax=Cydia pomonella TaxID=82600 RepID=UPI002ADD952B|nr:uncharacterized protein LOC133516034 isoform X2 [Cydia pomonella]XP_061718327.1 uncharacterized protein LOC133525922 isoform X2 [Cydia pomonella]